APDARRGPRARPGLVAHRPAVPARRLSAPSPARLRAFVRRTTVMREVPGLPGIRLHTADDVTVLWHATGRELALEDPPLPYWGFAWPGGLAIAHHISAHPDTVAGRRVLDLGTGSGLCGIVALRAGAAAVLAVDIDPIARAAAALNARGNDVDLAVTGRDVIAERAPDLGVDPVLGG